MSIYVYPINHSFKVGDKTAKENNWPDVEVDGSHIKVKYTSGNERWKMHISLAHALN